VKGDLKGYFSMTPKGVTGVAMQNNTGNHSWNKISKKSERKTRYCYQKNIKELNNRLLIALIRLNTLTVGELM